MTKVAAIQMCASSNVEENLHTAGLLIDEAAHNGTKLIVLPEMFAIMGKADTDKLHVKEVFGTGKIQDFLSTMAKKHRVWINGGAIPISCKNPNKIRSASLMYDSEGQCVGHYDKMHLFDVTVSAQDTYKESNTTEAGNNVVVLDSPFGKLGLSICYDIRFPALYTGLRDQGAQIMLIPSAFTQKTGAAHWHVLTRSRAIETCSYVIAANQFGQHDSGKMSYGHTLIIDPWGKILDEVVADQNGIAYAEVDLNTVSRMRASIPVDQHQRLKVIVQ